VLRPAVSALAYDVLCQADGSFSDELWGFSHRIAAIGYNTSTRLPPHKMCTHAPVLPGQTSGDKWILGGFYSCVGGTGFPLRKRREYDILFVGTCACSFPYTADMMKHSEGRYHAFEFLPRFTSWSKIQRPISSEWRPCAHCVMTLHVMVMSMA
jgi:hypothetical protein